jgi:undecaprenyl-diphosphatase
MNQIHLSNPHVLTTIFLLLTMILGLIVAFLPLNDAECRIVLDTQNLAQKTVGIRFFQILTYIGDFYLWLIFASTFLVYAYFRQKKRLPQASEIALFLITTTALTYLTKAIFVRPRPDCSGLTAYSNDVISFFSYPSGHVSRAAGGFLILSRRSRAGQTLSALAIFLVSISRIALGAHYPTDVLGGVFLSLAAQQLASIGISYAIRLTSQPSRELEAKRRVESSRSA